MKIRPLRMILGLCFLLGGLSASAIGATLYVENNTSYYLTVNVDGVYGCNTAAGSTCSIPVEPGNRELDALRSDTGERKIETHNIPSGGFTWRPW